MSIKVYQDLAMNDFLDSNLKPILISFNKYLFEESGLISDDSSWYKFKKCVSKMATTFSLNDLNETVILNFYTTSITKSYEALYVNRFLIYLLENNFITDTKVKRLLYFKNRLTKQGKASDIIKILKYDKFEEYISVNSNYENQTAIRELFFFTIDCTSCVDSRIALLSQKYIEKIKFSSVAPTSKIQFCQKFNRVFQIILKNLSLEEINLLNLKRLIEQFPSNTNCSVFTQLSRFLIFIQEENVYLNPEIESFLRLKDFLIAGVKKDTYLELLSCSDISKYRFLPCNKNDKIGNYLTYINISCKEIYDVWYEYACQSYYRDAGFMTICKEFDTSLANINVSSISDLNFSTYCQQINHFKQYNNYRYLRPLIGFYLYILSNYNNQLFSESGVDPRILQRTKLSREILEGYDITLYNPIESVPTSDKWLLCYSGMEDTNSSINATSTRCLDFSTIKSDIYRNWYKSYVWQNNSSLKTKTHNFGIAVSFFNYVTDLKSGKELSIYTQPNSEIVITTNEIVAYKNHILNTQENNRTRNCYIYTPRAILKHIEDNNFATFEKGVFHHLSHTVDSDYDNAHAIPDSHLKQLSNLMKHNALNSLIHAIYYSIFYIALQTEFRASQILALTIDCVEEANKKNQYVLRSKTKVSAGIKLEQPITTYVKKHIDEIIKLTDGYRSNCSIDKLKKYLFLVPGFKAETYKLISQDDFNNYLKLCCQELNLPSYTFSNLRDTHMTKAEEFIIRNSMSEIEQTVLTGHKSSATTTKHYIDTPLITLLESIHGVTIGNVSLEGTILKEASPELSTNENKVCNDCGYCQTSSCHNLTYLDCLLCKDFVTTLDRIPFFKEQLKIIDYKLQNASIRHDKEDLINIKGVLLKYLSRLLELKGESLQ